MGSLLSMILLGSLIVGTIFLIRSGKLPKLSSFSLPSFMKPSSEGSNQGSSGAVLKYSLLILGILLASIAIAFVFLPEALKANFSPHVWKAILIAVVVGIVARLAQAKKKMDGLTELFISLAIAVVAGVLTFYYLGHKDGTSSNVSALCKDEPSVRIREYGQRFTLQSNCSKVIFIRDADRAKFKNISLALVDSELEESSRQFQWVKPAKIVKNRDKVTDYEVKLTPTKAFRESQYQTLEFTIIDPTSQTSASAHQEASDEEAEGIDFLTPVP